MAFSTFKHSGTSTSRNVALYADKRTALVTGSTDGIGLTTAKNLAARGFNVILHGRDQRRIKTALETVTSFVADKGEPTPELYSICADISTIGGCKSFIQQVHRLLNRESPSHVESLDILLHNAGVFETNHVLTEDGLEMTFAVNVLAPFVIASQLLSTLLPKNELESEAEPVQKRIVITSSISQCGPMGDAQWDDLQCLKRSYSTHRAYSESKYMDALLAAEIATRLEEKRGLDCITCNSLDPGTVNTKMLLAGWGPCGIDVEDALDQTWLCTSEDVKGISGTYFNWKSPSKTRDSYKLSERQKLWSILSEIDSHSAQQWVS